MVLACGDAIAAAAASRTSARVVTVCGREIEREREAEASVLASSSVDVSVASFHCESMSGAPADDVESSAASGGSHCALIERCASHGVLPERGIDGGEAIGERPCAPGERGSAANPGVLWERVCVGAGGVALAGLRV